MPITAQFRKEPQAQYPKLKAINVTHCVHCYQPLRMTVDGSRRGNKKDRHECAESLLAKQPATPAPFN